MTRSPAQDLQHLRDVVARRCHVWVAARGPRLLGYLAVHFTQHTMTPHFHFGEETHAVSGVAGTSALVGLLLHTFFDGVAIASGFLVRPALGLLLFFAILLHKLPEGVTIASIMLAGGRRAPQGVLAAGLLGGATVAGVLFTDRLSFLGAHGLALSGGVTLYVAASNLVPEFQAKPGWRLPLAFETGVQRSAAAGDTRTADLAAQKAVDLAPERLRKQVKQQAEARYAALRTMGAIGKSMEECRDVRRMNLVGDFLADIRYAARSLRRSPGFPHSDPGAGGPGRPGRVFTFAFAPMVPGRYLIAVVPNPGVSFPTAPAILERLRPLAVPVTLVAGETAKVEVRVSR